MDNSEKARSTREKVEKLFPGKKIFMVAIEDVDFDNFEGGREKSTESFLLSTISNKSDVLQLALIISKDTEIKELLKDVISISDILLADPEIKEKVESLTQQTNNF